MARIRSIKPEFFTSLTIAELTVEARLTFIGLWTHVDDKGRCVDEPRLIKGALWAIDDRTAADVEMDLKALQEASLIVRYEVGGRWYLAVRNWHEHQKINHASESKLPGPEEAYEPAAGPLTSENNDSRNVPGDLPEDTGNDPGSLPLARADQGTGKGTGNREQGAGNARVTPGGEACDPTVPESWTAKPPKNDPSESFDKFWDVYPQHAREAEARTAWAKALKRGANPDQVIAAAQHYADVCHAKGTAQDYVAYACNWLDKQRYNEPPEPIPRPRGPHRPTANATARSGYNLQI